MAEFMKAASKSEIPAGTGKAVDVGGQKVALFNVDGTFYAIANACAHRGGPLGEGDLSGSTVTCGWNGWQYDVKTGAALHKSASVKSYPVKVQGEDVLVEI